MKILITIRRLFCRYIFHIGPLYYGGGMMEDAIRCDCCGRDKYQENWSTISYWRSKQIQESKWLV